MEKRLFTSECVTNGHPDKVADSISDAILDACLAQDPNSRVACETSVTTNFCLICGEITTKAVVDYKAIAREAIRHIGYIYPDAGFDADSVARNLADLPSVGMRSAVMRLEKELGATVDINSSTAPGESGTVIRIEIPDRRPKRR